MRVSRFVAIRGPTTLEFRKEPLVADFYLISLKIGDAQGLWKMAAPNLKFSTSKYFLQNRRVHHFLEEIRRGDISQALIKPSRAY